MTPKEKVREYFPEAFRAPFPVADVWDIITPSRRPSPGYKSHRVLGAGTTPGAAWADAAKRILRRHYKRRPVEPSGD